MRNRNRQLAAQGNKLFFFISFLLGRPKGADLVPHPTGLCSVSKAYPPFRLAFARLQSGLTCGRAYGAQSIVGFGTTKCKQKARPHRRNVGIAIVWQDCGQTRAPYHFLKMKNAASTMKKNPTAWFHLMSSPR